LGSVAAGDPVAVERKAEVRIASDRFPMVAQLRRA
jgi:hypothetical protein